MLYTGGMAGSDEGESAEAEEAIAQIARATGYSGPRMRNYQPSMGSGRLYTYLGMKMDGSGTVGYRPFRVKRVRFEKDE